MSSNYGNQHSQQNNYRNNSFTSNANQPQTQNYNPPNQMPAQRNYPPSQGYQRNYNYQNNSNFNPNYYNYNYQNQPYQDNNNSYREKNNSNQNWNHKNHQNQNFSVEYKANVMQNSFNDSFASQAQMGMGMPEVGRFGGAKKKQRQNDSSFSSSVVSKASTEPKVRQPTVKQESSNEFYFPIHTETTTFVECPFNSNHIMEPSRLLTHISKCKLKSENAKFFAVCPYEPTHYFYQTEIDAHILVCDKRHLFVVSESWDDGVLNSSTTTSIKNSVEPELISTSSKAPSSKYENEDKRVYEEFLIDL